MSARDSRDDYPLIAGLAAADFAPPATQREAQGILAELDSLRGRCVTAEGERDVLKERCKDVAGRLLTTTADIARMGWVARDNDLSDQSHDNLLAHVRHLKAMFDTLSIGEAERQEAARLARRAAAVLSGTSGEPT